MVRLHIIVDVSMKSKVITILLLVLFSFSAASTEKELDENLQYFKEIYTQANAQYEYEKELGLVMTAKFKSYGSLSSFSSNTPKRIIIPVM